MEKNGWEVVFEICFWVSAGVWGLSRELIMDGGDRKKRCMLGILKTIPVRDARDGVEGWG